MLFRSLPRLKTDIVSAMLATTTQSLGHFDMRWDSRAAVTVVMASKGYPGPYGTGSVIGNLDAAENGVDRIVFHAGTGRDATGRPGNDGDRPPDLARRPAGISPQ